MSKFASVYGASSTPVIMPKVGELKSDSSRFVGDGTTISRTQKKKLDLMCSWVVRSMGDEIFKRISKGVYVKALDNPKDFIFVVQINGSFPALSSIVVYENHIQINIFSLKGVPYDCPYTILQFPA